MSKLKGAFEEVVELVLSDGFAAMAASLLGKSYTSTIIWPTTDYYIMECLLDHTYIIDAGIGGVKAHYKKGDIVEFRDLSIHAMDSNMWAFIRMETR